MDYNFLALDCDAALAGPDGVVGPDAAGAWRIPASKIVPADIVATDGLAVFIDNLLAERV